MSGSCNEAEVKTNVCGVYHSLITTFPLHKHADFYRSYENCLKTLCFDTIFIGKLTDKDYIET